MRRFPLFLVMLLGGFLLAGANGCSSDPNVEGAKLDLRNKDYDRALENLETALERNPQNAEAHYLMGQVLQERAASVQGVEAYEQNADKMVAAYRQAAELDAELADDVTQRLRVAYYDAFQRGVQAFNKGQEDRSVYNQSAEFFRMAAEIQPDSAGAYINQGYALLNAGNQAQAIAPFEMAIEKGDTQPETFIFLADLYRTNEQPEQAVAVLERARQIHPDDADVQAQLLNAYIEANQVDRAMETYREAVERDPENKLYRYNYGSLLLSAGDYDAAIEQLQRAVELDPEYGNAHYNLGASYINKAVDLSDRINAIDDDLRANRSSMSQSEIQQREQEMEQLAEERRAIFEKAVGPLERAKAVVEASGDDATEICQALFSAYVQTDRQEQAQSIAECAGYEDLN